MVVTVLGMTISAIFEPLTKLLGITCTSLPIVTCSIFAVGISPFELQLMAFHVSCLILVQPVNAPPPILVIELGMNTLVRSLQLMKA